MRRSRFILIAGLIIAVFAAAATFALLQQPATPAAEAPATMQLAVAIEQVPAGSPIDPKSVELRDWPIDTAPTDAIVNLADLQGKYAKTDIFTGQVVQGNMTATPSELAQIGGLASALIPSGMVAFPFPITELSGVAYALNSGDRVDVLITFPMLDVDRETQVQLPVNRGDANAVEGVQIPRLVSQLTLQNIEVLRVGSWYEPPEPTEEEQAQQPPAAPLPPSVVTLMLTQQDALVLQYAREARAVVDFALRNPGDAEVVVTESVTLDYMLARFNMTVPIKRDQTLQTLLPQ